MADHDEDAIKLALLAHDLRTPLAAMRLTADLIGKDPLNETQSDHLSILVRSIDALTEMTGDLVEGARSGHETRPEAGTVADVVREVTELFEVAATAKGLVLEHTVDVAAGSYRVRKSANIRRVMTTLLDNAIKYTSAGSISIRLERGPKEDQRGEGAGETEWARLTVADSGPGIDPEEAARLFRPFVRGSQGRLAGPGSGLGLWGVEQLVKEMQGRIGLERAENGGCRFSIDFPVTLKGDAGFGSLQQPSDSGQRQSALQDMQVLVVDDNETNCRLLTALLESFGVTSDVAGSGSQAIALAEKADYDAVLLDLHMPDMSGIETAERLMALPRERVVPLIAVTAALESAGDERLREAGFRETLTKPLSPTALYEALSNSLLRKAARWCWQHPLIGVIGAVVVVSLFFLAFPGVDLWASSFFFFGQAGFAAENVDFLRDVRHLGPFLVRVIAISCVGILALKFLVPGRPPVLPLRMPLFLLSTLILGPGVLVNLILKDNWGRPRPRYVEEFNGELPFQPVWKITEYCDRNCSFTSGEASAAMWLVALVFLVPVSWRKAALAFILPLGLILSVNRVAFGGHFLSDTLLSWGLTLLVILVAYRLLYVKNPPLERHASRDRQPDCCQAGKDQDDRK
eukprot:g2491.t1